MSVLIFVVSIILILVVYVLLMGATQGRVGKPKGKFTVKGYKNGELILLKTYVDESFSLSPSAPGQGDFDRLEIEG